MAMPIGFFLFIKEPDFAKVWLNCFAADARTKKLRHNKASGRNNEITDWFLDTAGCKAIMKVLLIDYPRK